MHISQNVFTVVRVCYCAYFFEKLVYVSTMIDNKLHNYLKITGILNNVFKPQKTLKKTRLKLYNTLALPVLLYGSESWTIKARDARRITAAGMKYVRRTAGIKNNTNFG